MIKILCFHNATQRASYRYRVEQFLPYWSDYAIEMQAVCISGKEYLNLLRFLFSFHKYDYVLLQKKIIPRLLINIIAKKSKLIYDFDDAPENTLLYDKKVAQQNLQAGKLAYYNISFCHGNFLATRI